MPFPRFRINMPVREVIRSVASSFIHEDEDRIREFAEKLIKYGGYKNIILTGSGRSGFRLLLQTLNFPAGSEIIFPAYTFHIMPLVAVQCGLKPVFADVDPETWNINPNEIAPLINKNTRAVMPTHLFGMPADLRRIREIARNYGILVFEDCAHAMGALEEGNPVGVKSDVAIFTFAMSKNLPCWGGSAIVIKDPELADRMKHKIDTQQVPPPTGILRRQLSNIFGILATQPMIFPWSLYPLLRLADRLGSDFFDRPFLEEVALSEETYKNNVTGLSPWQAAVGLRQLECFPSWLENQVKNARYLRELLDGVPGLKFQQEPPGTEASFLYIRARVNDPPAFRRALLKRGIDTKPDDMRNCAALEVFSGGAPAPVAEFLGGHCIELPCSHFYSKAELDKIAFRTRDIMNP